MKAMLSIALATALLAVMLGSIGARGAGAPGRSSISAAAYYRACGKVKVGGHGRNVFAHRLGCRSARRKARYVLRTHRAPRGWRCELAAVRRGTTACARGSRAFATAPRR